MNRQARIDAIPAWYWAAYPTAKQQVIDGNDELLEYIEDRIEDWRTDPLD